MNTHNIELPPLPQGKYRLSPDSRAPTLYDEEAMEAFARAAVEADRKRRGKPVAWRVHPFDYGVGYEGVYALTSRPDQVAAWERKGWEVQPLYTAPQPAESCESLMSDKTACGSENWDCDSQPAEPEPCFCDRMYTDSNPDASCGDCPTRDYGVKPAEPVNVPSDTDIDELSREWGLQSAAYPSKSMVRDFARALLARYGKGTP